MLAAIEEADRLREQADGLADEHSRATLAGDADRAADLQRQYRDLQDRANAVEESAGDSATRLRESGVVGEGREQLEARIVALKNQSRGEIETLERVAHEAAELLAALKEQAEPFVRALPTGAERTQSRYVLTKT